MLSIQNLCKEYPGGKKAVVDLSLEVMPGEILGFIGHNGAGKTTTLRCAAGILSFDSGEITIGGKSIRKDPVGAKRQLAFLPDNPDIYEFMTGIQFLNFIADLYEIPETERKKRIEKYGDAFELTGSLGSRIGGYSHGMRQKLSLISAFIRKPQVLILDEPFVGLDPAAAYQMKEFLRELCMEGGSVFFSTHVLEVAEKLCHRLAIIREGKLIEVGKTEDVVGNSSLEEVFLTLEKEGEKEA